MYHHAGEGMGNLLALIVDACQGPLAKRLMYSEELQATVLEVKALPGLGTTIDCILVNGILREGDTVIIAGTDGPIVTQIRSLLMPQPLKELRVKVIFRRETYFSQATRCHHNMLFLTYLNNLYNNIHCLVLLHP
jgi:translation initiation factor 5B